MVGFGAEPGIGHSRRGGGASYRAAQRRGGQRANGCGGGTEASPTRPDRLCPGRCSCKSAKSCEEMPGMMDKGSDYLGKGRSNGTKSPSNASNGHFSEESGSDDEHGEYSLEQPLCALRRQFAALNCSVFCRCLSDVGMRVGADYQANIPDFEPGEWSGGRLADWRW